MMQSTRNKRAIAWEHMSSHERFTVTDIANVLSESADKGREIVKEFESKGLIRHVSGIGVAGRPKQYSRIDGQVPVLGRGHCNDERAVRHRGKKTKRQKMWNAMKMNRTFTRVDMQMTADVTDSHAKDFLCALIKSGYVRYTLKVKAGQKSRGVLSRYTLLRDTGCLAPIVRKSGVWDQNQQLFYPFDKGAET